jgi:nitrite reductase (NADH) large subunit
VQDAMATGIELERRLENLYTPHKTKLGVTGCPRNCAEVTVKDIGLVGQDGSWQVVVGGAAGKHVRKADLLITVKTTDEAIEAAMLFFQYYRENGNYLERTYDFVERLGIEKIRKDTVYAQPKEKRILLRRLQKAKALSKDAWLDREKPTPTQFVQIQPLGVAEPMKAMIQ